ncbi:MAG: leucine-rich repeat domain-containing protein [Bacteroidota bacterium]|nr:leucine-rich repeat domain-containing protein [Bacteroidota bacterium]
MEPQVYFNNIEQQIISELEKAKYSIWFASEKITSNRIYNVLIRKASSGTSIEILTSHDSLNELLNIELEKKGCKFYYIKEEFKDKIIQNPFCIIDLNTVISGSYNWANEDFNVKGNIILTRDSRNFAEQFADEFNIAKQNIIIKINPSYNSDELNVTAEKIMEDNLHENTSERRWWKSIDNINLKISLYKNILEPLHPTIEDDPSDEQIRKMWEYESLYLSCTTITRKESSLKGIEKLTKLKTLIISGNWLFNSLEHIEKLENLEKLYLTDVIIFNLKGIENLKKLRIFQCKGNLLNFINEKLVVLTKLTQLEELLISSNMKTNITNLDFVEKLTNLKIFTITDCKISNIEPISKLVNLRELNVSNNRIFSLRPIKNLINLKVLNFSLNKVRQLSHLSDLKQIKSLECSYNKIKSLDSIENFINLEHLDCSFNPINSLEPIKTLYNLNNLNCSFSSVKSLDPLKELKKVKTISIQYTRISSLKSLLKLDDLEYLYYNYLNNSEINDIKERFPNAKLIDQKIPVVFEKIYGFRNFFGLYMHKLFPIKIKYRQ